MHPSAYVKSTYEDDNITVKRDLKRKSFVSTKRSNSVTLPFKVEYEVSNNSEYYNSMNPFITVAGFNNKSFTFKVGKNIILHDMAEGGHINATKSAPFLRAFAQVNIDGEQQKIYVSGDVFVKWEESKTASSEDEKEMLIPEFDALLSTIGGVFTEKNIDQPFPGDGLPPGAIAGIVIACIAVVAIIAVCIWLFAFGGIKKCKKDKSESGSGTKKEQDQM